MPDTINYSIIRSRSSCKNSDSIKDKKQYDIAVENSKRLYINLKSTIESDNMYEPVLRLYLESMCNKASATENCYTIFSLIESMEKKDKSTADYIVNEYCNRILPYDEELSASNYIDRYDISENNSNFIKDKILIYRAADRILRNNSFLSENFDLESKVKSYPSISINALVESIADCINTFGKKGYQKLNITIEETCFLLEKIGKEYDKNEVLREALKYYTLRYQDELEYINKVAEENCFISESVVEIDNNGHTEDKNPDRSIKTAIDYYIKNIASTDLYSFITNTIKKSTKIDIMTNIDKIYYLFWDLSKSKVVENEKIIDTSKFIIDYLSDFISCQEDMCKVVDKIVLVRDDILNRANSNKEFNLDIGAMFNYSVLVPFIDTLTILSKVIYKKSNIENIKADSKETVQSLEEYKIFKFHNLVRAAFNFDKFLKLKEKNLINKAKPHVDKFISKTKNILWGEAADVKDDILNYIGEDCRADICVRQYSIEESDIPEAINFLEDVCDSFNDGLYADNCDSIRAYYTINPGMAEIRIKELAKVQLTEEEYNNMLESLDPSLQTYIDLLNESNNGLDIIEEYNLNSMVKNMINLESFDEFNDERFKIAIEAMKYLDIDSATRTLFATKYAEYKSYKEAIYESTDFSSLLESCITSINEDIYHDVPFEIQMEALSILCQILEADKPAVGPAATKRTLADDWDDEDDEEDDDTSDEKEEKKEEDKKPEPKESKEDEKKDEPKEETRGRKNQFNLRNIRLALKGLGAKFKNMNTKQKEISRNLDAATRSLVKGFKDSLVSDRREAIIKGSVIPSFSRCIKFGLGLTVLGLATGNPAIPVIVALGAFATSKQLTKKERILLLDEIENELEVVDKEISMAEDERDMKKFRALLNYKKNLQRQYQRIRYNIRVGKDILPGSSEGLPTSRD